MKILCSISTKNRYDCLPLAISSVATQTRTPDHLTIYDDNDSPQDLRSKETYLQLFRLLDAKGIGWDVQFGEKKGQHYNHQRASKSGYDAVWRLDDDCIAECDVLKKLEGCLIPANIGAVGGSIITPPIQPRPNDANSLIDGLDKPNKQWFPISNVEEVEHLHCSYLYRTGIVNYDLRLSKKAHREETMHSYGIRLKGYKLLIVPCITWHLKSQIGGIRSDDNIQDYQHDEWLFQNWLKFKKTGKKLYVLNNGLGDHYMFQQAVAPPVGAVIACCYPEVFKNSNYELISIADAMNIVDTDPYDIYRWCIEHQWKGTLIGAFTEMYRKL